MIPLAVRRWKAATSCGKRSFKPGVFFSRSAPARISPECSLPSARTASSAVVIAATQTFGFSSRASLASTAELFTMRAAFAT